MSNRRLAEESVQPASFAFSSENAGWAQTVIKKYPEGRQASAVIPLLMRAQEQEGWVSRAAIEYVGQMLGMPYIRVLEVATFYTQFQIKPVGTKAHVQVCGTTPCMLRGAGDLMDVCRSKIHPEPEHLNEDGTLSWEEVECQGACVNAPMIMIFKDTYEDLTPERLAEIIDDFSAGKGADVPVGPQNGRTHSAPIGALTALSDETIFTRETRRQQGKSSVATDGTSVPPSNAAKPKTDALETSRAVKSPSSVKVSAQSEAKAGVSEPAVSLDDPNRPAAIDKPETPDDLQLIAGVGPKNETLLHELGIYTWAQIGAWKTQECDWVDAYLSFKGRIAREEWVKQAAALASGGEAEYIRVFGKKPR